jgi:hypothetical protein
MVNPAEGALITVAASGAVGYGIYRLTRPKYELASPLDLGRKCFGWMAVIVSFATLPPFFQHFDANFIATWAFGLVFYGGLAFGVEDSSSSALLTAKSKRTPRHPPM